TLAVADPEEVDGVIATAATGSCATSADSFYELDDEQVRSFFAQIADVAVRAELQAPDWDNDVDTVP
ncbi:MAG: hypothetical protein M3527_06320, partial [Actinomycetota bacterium]|nr:hypothetical protein [Actinomycetota bacterium]